MRATEKEEGTVDCVPRRTRRNVKGRERGESKREGGKDVNGSFPRDVRGSRVPWRAAGRVHGVFRVVLRYTVVRGRHACVP